MNKNQLTFKKFKELAKKHKIVPVFKQVLSDLLTPVAAWAHLCNHSKYGFILESVEKGNNYSRFSYLGIDPKTIIKLENNVTLIETNGNQSIIKEPFIEVIDKIQKEYQYKKIEDLPPFTGGLIGYLNYEMVEHFDNIPINSKSELNLPKSLFMLFEDIIIFDHLKGTSIILSNIIIDKKETLLNQYDHAHEKIDRIGEKLHSRIEYQTPRYNSNQELSTNLNEKDFKNIVLKAKSYIEEGEIFQVVLSRKFKQKINSEPVTIYRALRTINPSPYMFHLKVNDFDIIGASPELMVKIKDSDIEIRPIAGTRPRGKNKKEDDLLSKQLISDKKELAEHLMLLDLGRNDVGKVSEFGSVKVTESMKIEKYSHVMHIVSSIKGKLDKDIRSLDALISGFPAGTVTGAPKIRAMEIINELENETRDIYSGAVCFIDFNNNINSCIAIRTLIIKDKNAHFQAGAGIVYHSDPSSEYEETLNKAKAIINAIKFAENGLSKK